MTKPALRELAGDHTLVMGVLNATPDSFYGPSRCQELDAAREWAGQAVESGADVLDVGGESSRPGAKPVGAEEEIARTRPIVEALSTAGYRVSIDTCRAGTARAAIEAGAQMVNDITALRGDPDMAAVVADAGVDCVLMHMQGTPETMQEAPDYRDVVADISEFFEERIAFAVQHGIARDKLWLDPGFGFGKMPQHNLELLRRLGEFRRFDLPILIGTSNKSTIGKVLDLPLDQRLEGTAATVAAAIERGAAMVRVHDIRAMTRVARMMDAIVERTSHG